MIRRIRIQFIGVTMALMAVLLVMILSVICASTWRSMADDASKAMQSATFEPWQPGGMSREGVDPNYPCFLICMDPFGNLSAKGHDYYDLSDEALLRTLLQEARATGKSDGYLPDRNLRFQKIELWHMEEYVFTDISSQLRTMEKLRWICVLIFLVAMGVFFGFSWLLSKWMVRPLEQAWQQQRQFVADVSHELKTPLTVILTNAELLHSGEYSPQDNRRFAESILIMSNQMRSLVEHLLELARMDNKTRPLQSQTVLDLSELTEDSIMSFEPVYFESDRTLESQVQPGIAVLGSQQYLRQVVDILLDNGRKYSEPGTVVRLELTRQRNRCQLRVDSVGNPLTPQQCKDIFKRFYRADEARSRDGSYGLGLPIAQSIIASHRGKIWCHSKDGINSFFVTLPTHNQDK